MSKYFSVILVLLIASCTVTKRHYNKGFNVEWHKNYITKHSSKAEQEIELDNNLVSDEVESFSQDVDSVAQMVLQNDVLIHEESFEVKTTVDEEPINYTGNSQLPSKLKQTIFKRMSNSKNRIRSLLPLSRAQDSSAAEGGSSDELLIIIGFILLFLGIFLILGSLYFVFGFPGLNGLFSTLVFSGNGFIAGLFGFLLYLLILLLVILFVLLVQFVLGYLLGLILGLSFLAAGIVLLLIFR